MKTVENLLTLNEWSRPGKQLAAVKAVILHWTGNPKSDAALNRAFFESRKNGKLGYGSAHYIIDLNGDVLQCIPDGEVAYHCGTSEIDPSSGKIYTDWAREIFGKYASATSSPNKVSIGIELCVLDDLGTFSPETLESAVELTAILCIKFNLGTDKIGTHNKVVGWKDCPRLWTVHPELFEELKAKVKSKLDKWNAD